VSSAPRVRFLTKPGCHLCDDARPLLDAELAALGLTYDEVDITTDDELYARFWTDIPVVLVDDEVVAVHRLPPGTVTTHLHP
jgi:glutaredoxin